jgi:hypothetical protein
MTAADAHLSHEFCAFELPGCEGCPKAMHVIKTVGSSEDPMKSMAWSGWIAGASRPKSSFAHNQGGPPMEKFIHQQNLTLFKKCLAEARTDAEREVLLKLLVDEEAKEPPLKNSMLKPR